MKCNKKFNKLSGTRAEYPFDGYKIYPSIIINIRYLSLSPINKNGKLDKNKKKIFISYSRYLMCVKEGRILSKNEEVDHIDNNKTNDDPSNLQIITPKDNKRKEIKHRGTTYAIIKCPWCREYYLTTVRKTHLKKGGLYTTCSRKCSRKFRAMYLRDPYDKKVEKRINENISDVFKVYDKLPFEA